MQKSAHIPYNVLLLNQRKHAQMMSPIPPPAAPPIQPPVPLTGQAGAAMAKSTGLAPGGVAPATAKPSTMTPPPSTASRAPATPNTQ